MFTGIIEAIGIIRSLEYRRDGAELVVKAEGLVSSLRSGHSIAVNGVCLTVTRCESDMFSCDLSAETLHRSTLGRARLGMRVNLERPLAVGDRLGGHFVLGHVDGMGSLARNEPSGEGRLMAFRFPRELERYLVHKGSVAVDGISLTIASLKEEVFSVAVIPQTLDRTILKNLKLGDSVNLEVDILGKYFERFFQLGQIQDKPQELTLEYLKEQGF